MFFRRAMTPALALLVALGVGTTGVALAASPAGIAQAGASTLDNGKVLRHGGGLRSPSQAYSFEFQADSNLVVYRVQGRAVVWAANTAGLDGVQLHLQSTGNLVLLNSQNALVWETRTTVTDASGPATFLRLLDDGSLQLVRYGAVVWSTPADAPHPAPTSARPTAPPRPTPSPSAPRPPRPVPTEPEIPVPPLPIPPPVEPVPDQPEMPLPPMPTVQPLPSAPPRPTSPPAPPKPSPTAPPQPTTPPKPTTPPPPPVPTTTPPAPSGTPMPSQRPPTMPPPRR